MWLTSLFRPFLVMLTLAAASAFPYELEYSGSNGSPMRWEGARIEMAVSTSFLAAPNIKGDEDPVAAIRRAARTWSEAGNVEIVLTLSEELSVSPSGPSGDGVSLITIAQTPQNLLLFAGPNSQRPALTRVFFDNEGRIVEADIVINPYFFTSTDGTPGSFDLESTMVHEFGHALGLGHSYLPGSSMNDTSSRNGLYTLPFTLFRTLSRDDLSGLRALYGPSPGTGDCCGSVTGTLDAEGGRKGSYQIWLESAESGAVEAGTLSSPRGRFRLEGIASGTYHVYLRDPAGTARAARLGTVSIASGKNSRLSAVLSAEKRPATLSSAGFNGEIASIAVPVNSGSAYKIYLSGKGSVRSLRLESSAPGIRFELSSVEALDYGEGLEVVTVNVEIGEDIQPGEYSIRVLEDAVIVDVLPSALAVEPIKNPWIQRQL